MLIGISGKMGAGKNLVCTIIQGLTAAKKHNIENIYMFNFNKLKL